MNYRTIIKMTIANIATPKYKLRLRSYHEDSITIYVSVWMNKAMYTEAELRKPEKEFKEDLKTLVKSISDWAKTIQKKGA